MWQFSIAASKTQTTKHLAVRCSNHEGPRQMVLHFGHGNGQLVGINSNAFPIKNRTKLFV
jgi:hypothetical protein